MGIILDLFVIAILVLSIIMGYKKGLIGVVYSLCAFLVAIVVTWILYTPITKIVIDNTQFDENIKNFIIEKGAIDDKDKEKNENEEKNTIDKYIQQYVKTPVTNSANSAIEETANVVSQKVVAIGVAIGLFLIVRIALILLKFIAEGLANLPIIKQFNRAGGTLYGFIRGAFIVYLVLAILFFIMSVNSAGVVANAINTSIISKYLYANNLILNIIF